VNPVVAICLGACGGSLLRWLLGLGLNSLFPAIPLGTLCANLAGGYIIGIAASVFATCPALGQQWALLVITGFLGSLTTFSAFSFEVASLLEKGQLPLAALAISLHVGGSLIMTFLGMGTWALVKQ
jgi:CrcB protein